MICAITQPTTTAIAMPTSVSILFPCDPPHTNYQCKGNAKI